MHSHQGELSGFTLDVVFLYGVENMACTALASSMTSLLAVTHRQAKCPVESLSLAIVARAIIDSSDAHSKP